MITTPKVILLVVLSHALIFLGIYVFQSKPTSLYEVYFDGKANALVKDFSLMKKQSSEPESPYKKAINPFKLLDAYPEIPQDLFTPKYNKVQKSIKNEDDYCERVDMYNLMNPENMFENKNFFTDFTTWTIITKKVLPKVGTIMMDYLNLPMSAVDSKKAMFPFDTRINNFYVSQDGFYRYHKIGQNYLCPTQMFNHIPGHKSINSREDVLNSVQRYEELNNDNKDCFNPKKIFPQSFRLAVEEECNAFFDLVQTEKYFDNLEAEPIQFLVKMGHGAHSAEGVFVLDEDVMTVLDSEYDYGNSCGKKNDSLIVQKYINNPLLLDNNNKFDFRVFMFVASTNPLIVYYHDGYIRTSFFTFDKFSIDPAVHLTTSSIAEEVVKEAQAQDATVNGMNAEELRHYHIWSFADLEAYLLYSEKTDDLYWLDNFLRPEIKKALVHLVRATSYSFWKESNIHELYGMNFMLDDKFNLWFIDATPNPVLTGVEPEMIEKMLLDMFEIQYAYYHSRMKRVLDVIYKLQDKLNEENKNENENENKNDDVTLEDLKAEYKQAVKNGFEPEYLISEDNSWSVFIDHNLLPSSDAYFGYLDDDCLHPEIEIY